MTTLNRIRTYTYILVITGLMLSSGLAQQEDAEANGVVFPLQVDWLSQRFASFRLDQTQGLSLLSPYASQTNRQILNINYKSRLKTDTQIDDSGENLIFIEEYDGLPGRPPRGIPLDTYIQLRSSNYLRNELKELCTKGFTEDQDAARSEKLELIGADIAGQRVSLRVSGNVNINGRLQNQKQSQIQTGYNAGTSTTFIVDQSQQLSIEGKIGDRISILVDQDSERDFDFENNMKIIYTGEEDDIVQKVEAGNISLSLPGTKYVTFSGTNNGLFGLKAQLQMGAVDITTIASVEKGKKEKLSVDGGAQQTNSFKKDLDYLQNTYFFLDHDYRSSLYDGFLENGGVFLVDPNRVVTDLEVYRSINTELAGSVYGYAYVDPNNTNQDTALIEQRLFQKLIVDQDYTTSPDLGYIRLKTPAQESEIIAVVYRTVNASGQTVDSYGDWETPDSNNITLKLIKPQSNKPDHPCWDLEFKNVYYLGTTGINKEGFELNIVYMYGETGEIERDPNDGKTFLEKFGLDIKDQSGNPTPDGLIDMDNSGVVNLQTGELWLPYLHPFQYDPDGTNAERNPNLSDLYNCSAMYDSNRTNTRAITQDSKFKITYKYENRSSVISLGAMVIENSESVTLGGTTLQRGVDYTIDYFTGTLTLLNEQALTPDANLDIKYERNQFFQLDQKTIVGARAQYDFGENSFIGGTALFFSQSVVDEKVDIGYEPMRNFVWDLNGRYNRNLNFLTRAINWLPLIETDRESSIKFEGEIARIHPNPNTLSNEETGDPRGVGYIDDFEGSKRVISPPIIQRYWSHSSVPLGKRENQRGFLYWYNPYGGVSTTSIWPDKQVSTTAQNTITDILVMTLDPDWSIEVADDVSPEEEAWGGVTYPFPSSYYDQSQTSYLEIWVKGRAGRMHIDLGYISEDVIANKTRDTEDKPEDGLLFGDGILDKDTEDTGIDGVFSTEEYITNSFGEIISYGDDRLRNYKRSPTDPHGDNWKYTEGSQDYRQINGTERNAKDATGYVPDTEDLDNDYEIDLTNDYFTVDFLLDDRVDDEFVEGRTQYQNGSFTGWKQYRIPLTEFRKAVEGGSISWETIEACRIWIEDMSEQDSISIAKIEMVGNDWEDLGIGDGTDGEFIKDEEAFNLSVLNTEDNPDTYTPPKGVEGEYDAVNEIQLKEQSLVMNFTGSRGLRPGEVASAKKVLYEAASFITYKKLKMFINGNNLHSHTKYYTDGEKTPLQTFIKFGVINDENEIYNYYECRQPVYPGWDKRNNLNIDLDFLTSLKLYASEEEFPDNDIGLKKFTITYDEDGDVIRRRWREVKDGQYTGKEILIVGMPTISNVTRIDIGIINQEYALDDFNQNDPLPRYDNTMYGEIWLDELRLSDVRRDAGMAYRGSAALQLADLGNVNVSLSHKDADFHTVEQRPSLKTRGLNNTNNISVRGKVNLDKLAPSKWGVSLPVSASYSNNNSAPKYLPNSDILSGDNPPDSVSNLSESYGANISYSKRASDYWLAKYTIDQLRASANFQKSNSSSIDYASKESETYKGSVSYKIPFGRDNYVQPFKWIKGLPYLGDKIGDARFYYAPSDINMSLNATENLSNNTPRIGEARNNHTMGLNRSISGGYKMLDNLNMTYSRKVKSSLNDYVDNKLEAIKELNPGATTNISESYSASFSPKIFEWFTPSLNYNANYNWSEPEASNTESVDQISNQNRLSSSFSLDPAAIFKTIYSPKSSSGSSRKPGGTSTRSRGRRSTSRGRNTTRNEPEEEKKEEKKKDSKEIPLLEFVYKSLDRIDPLQISYSTSRNNNNRGRVGEPGLLYRMGLESDPGLDTISAEAGAYPNTFTINSDASVRSGIKISKNIRTSLSFSQNMTWSESSGNKSHNMSRDYLVFDKLGTEGIPFPGWSVNISQIEKISFLSGVFKKLSLDHGFSGKESVSYQNGEMNTSTYRLYFQPLFNLSMQFKNDISSSLRMTMGQTTTNKSNGGATVVNDQSINASMNYQKRGGMTIPLPFLKNKRLENNITFTLSFDYSNSETRTRNSDIGKLSRTSWNKTWSVDPRITYSFTSKVNGAIFFSYSESENKTGTRITRNGGFDINIAIRG